MRELRVVVVEVMRERIGSRLLRSVRGAKQKRSVEHSVSLNSAMDSTCGRWLVRERCCGSGEGEE